MPGEDVDDPAVPIDRERDFRREDPRRKLVSESPRDGLVQRGMTPAQAIQSATLEAARLLKIDDRLGTIEPKKIADLVAVSGNPLDNIRLMQDVVFVMKEGTVYKSP